MQYQTIPKPRALPRVWKRFFQLRTGGEFTSPSGVLRRKEGPFWSRSVTLRCVYFHAPWTRVRTTTLVRDVLPGGKSSPKTPSVDLGVAAVPTIPTTPRVLDILHKSSSPFPSNMGRDIAGVRPASPEQTGPSA